MLPFEATPQLPGEEVSREGPDGDTGDVAADVGAEAGDGDGGPGRDATPDGDAEAPGDAAPSWEEQPR